MDETPTATRAREALVPGDRFDRPMPSYRGKPKLVTYEVTGHTEYKGRAYVQVTSRVQGAGSIALDALPPLVPLTH